MCFSAQASFATAGVLSVISLLSIRQAHTNRLLAFALTPLFFAIQQVGEGFVWITINNGDTTSFLHLLSVYTFLFFAGMFWPTWIPTALYIAEESPPQKKIIQYFIATGMIVSLTFGYCWILATTGAHVVNHHLDYPVINYPFGISNPTIAQITSYLLASAYGIVTIIPFFVSSIPRIKYMGILIAIGAVIAYILYLAAFPSVWCFFAAVCSILTYFVIRNCRNLG